MNFHSFNSFFFGVLSMFSHSFQCFFILWISFSRFARCVFFYFFFRDSLALLLLLSSPLKLILVYAKKKELQLPSRFLPVSSVLVSSMLKIVIMKESMERNFQRKKSSFSCSNTLNAADFPSSSLNPPSTSPCVHSFILMRVKSVHENC